MAENEQVANETASMVSDRAMTMIEDMISKLETGITEYGPDAIELLLEVARFEAAAGAARWTIIMLATAFGAYLCVKTWKWGSRRYDEDEREFSQEPPWQWVVAGIASTANAIIFFGNVFDFNLWDWVGIIEPKLWLAHRVVTSL